MGSFATPSFLLPSMLYSLAWPERVQSVCWKSFSIVVVGSVLALLLTSSAKTACEQKESLISSLLVVQKQLLKCRSNLIPFCFGGLFKQELERLFHFKKNK